MAIPAAPAPFITISKSSIFLFSINFIEFIMVLQLLLLSHVGHHEKQVYLKIF